MKSIIFSLLIIAGCNFKNSPEGVLKDYVNFRFEKGQSRSAMLDYLTGPIQEHYSNMSDEEFAKFSDMSKFKKKRFKIIYQNCTEAECSITYTIKYEQMIESNKTIAEIKRAATLVKIDEDTWKISDITSEDSKTHFEGEQAITPEDFKKQYNIEADNIQLDSSGNVEYDSDGKAKTK